MGNQPANPMPDAIYCKGCGRMIGVMRFGRIAVKHKGRTINIKPDKENSCTVEITCEQQNCKFVNEIRL